MSNSKKLPPARSPNGADLNQFFDSVEFKDTARISYVTSSIIVPAYDVVKRDFGIIRAEYMLLLCLSHFPVLTAQEVSAMTRRPRNSISRAVHRMLSVGYITRVQDPDDGRQARLSITQSGKDLHQQIADVMVAREEEVLSVLDRDERQTLRKIMDKVVKHAAGIESR